MTYEAAVAIIGTGFLWLLNITAFQLNDREHGSIKAFLMMMSFFLSVPLLNFARQILIDNSAGSEATNMMSIFLGGGMFSVLIVFIYLFYYWVRNILLFFTNLNDERKAKKGDVYE